MQPQFVASNEHDPSVGMDTITPTFTIILEFQSTTGVVGSGPTPSAATSPQPPVLQPDSLRLSSTLPLERSSSHPERVIKPLPRRLGCTPRPHPPPHPILVSSIFIPPAPLIGSTLVPSPPGNSSLENITLGALMLPSIPPLNVPPEMQERLNAMAGRMGVGPSVNARCSGPPRLPSQPQQPTSSSFGSTSFPGLGSSAGASGTTVPGLTPSSEQ
ncbi:hypothetical protein RHS04_07690 [Rhizoctonia solani]|uniref:Uncharacterized protein n=1 Tax=Rhizoctonia solani TaxID=456999 RepID=A0A8H7H321_9AGAM|nr:hypothetical protein RHS04_07690 [Rhizoctonia solani]